MLGRLTDRHDPIDPSPCQILRNESHDERSSRRTKSDQGSPNSHFESTLFLEESLGDDGTTNVRGTNEKGTESTTYGHRCVVGAESAADIEESSAEGRDEPGWSSSIVMHQWFPYQGRKAQDCDLERCKIGCARDGSVEIYREWLVCRNDGSGNEGCHARLKSYQSEVGVLLPVRPVV